MHNRIYRLAKIEFASFDDASLSRGSLHIVRRPLRFDVPILVYENSREPTAPARRNHIRFFASDTPQTHNTLFLVNSKLSGLLNKYTLHVIAIILVSTRSISILIRTRTWFLCLCVTISQPLAYGSAAPQN